MSRRSVIALGVGLVLLCQAAVPADPGESPLPSVSVAADTITVDGREVPLRILFRPDAGVRGVIVLSHGTFSSGKKYDAVARPWAEQGFVVILPDHRDADFKEVPRDVAGMMAIVASRVAEVRAIAGALPEIAQRHKQPAELWAAAPLVAAGHSVGTQVAMQVTGLRMRNPATGSVMDYAETRFAAAVLLSDPGKMAAMPPDVWEAGNVPVFMVTGPDDIGLMGDGRRDVGFTSEVLPPDDGVRPYRALLSVDGLDHQFGGLIHKQVDAEPDHEALAIFLTQSQQFLGRCVAGDAGISPPQTGVLSERATLSVTAGQNDAHGC